MSRMFDPDPNKRNTWYNPEPNTYLGGRGCSLEQNFSTLLLRAAVSPGPSAELGACLACTLLEPGLGNWFSALLVLTAAFRF